MEFDAGVGVGEAKRLAELRDRTFRIHELAQKALLILRSWLVIRPGFELTD